MDEQEIAGAMSRWTACQNEVTSAVQSYLEASRELHKLCEPPFKTPSSSAGSLSLPLERSLSGLALLEDALHDTRWVLHHVSHRLTRGNFINKLPDEILSSIFVLGLEQETISAVKMEEATNMSTRPLRLSLF
jgi:hypothetical protein